MAKYSYLALVGPLNFCKVKSAKIKTGSLSRFYEQSNNPRLSNLNIKHVGEAGSEIDWVNGWHRVRNSVINSPNFLQPDLILSPPDDEYRCYYEYRDEKYRWNIAVAVSDNVTGPYDTHHFPILTPSGVRGCPAETGIADPTVLYLEDADLPWHMWFDMRDSSGDWRIGHATSTDGIKWQIQKNDDGRPSTVIDIGDAGEWDDHFVHAPEAFTYNDRVRLVYNAQGCGHQNYDGGLAVASDPDGLGYEFEKVGQTTYGDTAVGGNDIRVKKPIKINDSHYAIHSRDIKQHATICKSEDGCESWKTVSQFPYPSANSFIKKGDYLVCIGSNRDIFIKKFSNNRS